MSGDYMVHHQMGLFLVISIIIACFGFSIRSQLRFLFGPKREIAGTVSAVEWVCVPDDNGSRWFAECKVEYEVEGKRYQLNILREVELAVGASVTLTYPTKTPSEAVEGAAPAASKKQIASIALILLILITILWVAEHKSTIPR
jgi:hypothetical protein